MNKAELISEVAAKAGLSKKDSEKAVNAALDTITATLTAGEKVQKRRSRCALPACLSSRPARP